MFSGFIVEIRRPRVNKIERVPEDMEPKLGTNTELDTEVWRRGSVHKGFGSEYGDLQFCLTGFSSSSSSRRRKVS